MHENYGFTCAYDLLRGGYDPQRKNELVAELYRAESSFLKDLVDEWIAEKVVESREKLEKEINEIYDGVCTSLPPVLTTKTHCNVVPYRIDIKHKGGVPCLSLRLVSWFKGDEVYIQPAGLYELEVCGEFPQELENYEIVLHSEGSMISPSASVCIPHKDLAENDRKLVENFVQLVLSYFGHVYEAERKMESLEKDLELMEKELNKLYADPVLFYSRTDNRPVGILIPPHFTHIVVGEDVLPTSNGKIAVEVDGKRLQRALLLLRAEAFDRAVVQEDWRWEPWYWYAEVKEGTVFR